MKVSVFSLALIIFLASTIENVSAECFFKASPRSEVIRYSLSDDDLIRRLESNLNTWLFKLSSFPIDAISGGKDLLSLVSVSPAGSPKKYYNPRQIQEEWRARDDVLAIVYLEVYAKNKEQKVFTNRTHLGSQCKPSQPHLCNLNFTIDQTFGQNPVFAEDFSRLVILYALSFEAKKYNCFQLSNFLVERALQQLACLEAGKLSFDSMPELKVYLKSRLNSSDEIFSCPRPLPEESVIENIQKKLPKYETSVRNRRLIEFTKSVESISTDLSKGH